MNYLIKPVDKMSVDELIGQVIMCGIHGTSLNDDFKQLIKKYKIGNYILFARNYNDTQQMKNFMHELYEETMDVTGSFPLVSIDQEGGMVVRLFKDVTFPASPLTTSATTVIDAPYETGYIIGKDMLKLGINLNLAPCLEVNENLENPLVNIRGYGANKEIVLENARKFVKGIQASRALSCIKHFPGAGSSTKDSHLELPIIDDDKETLLNYNMYPFLHLLESDALMTSHCLYKSFDDVPSTLSSVLLTDILRKKVGFNGLIISDGMEMKAILDHYGMEKGTIMALKAGCDILLVCHDYEYQVIAFESIKKAIKNNELSVELLKEKVQRINDAKEKVLKGLIEYFTLDKYIVQTNEHEMMQQIVDNSYTLVKGEAPSLTDKTLIISSPAIVASIVEDEFDLRNLTKVLKESFPKHTVLEFSKDASFENNLFNSLQDYDQIIIYSYDAYKDEIQQRIINKLLQEDIKVFLVSIKGPIDLPYFKNVVNYSCLYEYTPNSIRTIIKQLKKEIDLVGKLPK